VVFTKLHNYSHLMTAVTDNYCRALIKEVRPWQRQFRRRFGSTFVFLADEFYLRAGLSVPGRAHYGDYPQIEDGVGMVRRFDIAARRALKRDLAADFGLRPGSLYGTIATGELFYPILAAFLSELNARAGTRLKCVAVRNHFFGEEVTVAGLIAGRDFIAARESFEGDFLIVPEQACLKSGQTFLDDLTLEDLERELCRPVAHGGDSVQSMIGRAAALEKR
jgi:NifB/MoaA-like Fe-S oxidoreductase